MSGYSPEVENTGDNPHDIEVWKIPWGGSSRPERGAGMGFPYP